MDSIKDKVRHALEGLRLDAPRVDVYESTTSVFATVVSESFTGMDEAERQQRVWDALRACLSADENSAVEFVFTISPSEEHEQEAKAV